MLHICKLLLSPLKFSSMMEGKNQTSLELDKLQSQVGKTFPIKQNRHWRLKLWWQHYSQAKKHAAFNIDEQFHCSFELHWVGKQMKNKCLAVQRKKARLQAVQYTGLWSIWQLKKLYIQYIQKLYLQIASKGVKRKDWRVSLFSLME